MADKRTRWIIEATSNIPDINKQLEQLISLQRTQNELTQQNTTSTALAIQRQREQIEQLSSAQTKANNSNSSGVKQQTDMMGALRKEYDLLSKQLSGIAQLAAGAWVVGQLKTYVDQVIKAKSAQDGFVASMEQMLGSRLKAEELNAKLKEIALSSPFSVQQLQEVTNKLQGMGVETNKLIPYINMLGDISSVVGTQKLPLIAKALTDVQNKGVLMGQEIKQFTENGVPLFDLLAKSMQKPREEVVKLAEAHKIGFADVEKALLQATEKGGLYYGQMAVKADQLSGKVANLADKFELGLAKVGDFFEKGLRSGIETLGKFVDATIGSESAVARLVKIFNTALTMWVAYRAAVLSTSAALKVNQVETLADLAAKEASTVATVSMTTASAGLRLSLSGLWTVMKANPWGALITIVTAAIGIYQAWGVASMEVVSALGEEEIKLKNQKQLLNDSVLSVMSLKKGTDERRTAMENLIREYPEYFRGLSTEGTSNAALGKILSEVNGMYLRRIDLARQAYKIEELEKKRSEYLKDEADLMERIIKRSPELAKQVGGDATKLFELFQKNGKGYYAEIESSGNKVLNFFDDLGKKSIYSQTKTISEGLKSVDKELLEATQRRSALTKAEQNAAIDAENIRWKTVAAQMKKGTKEYETAFSDHEDKIREMSGKTKDIIFKNEDGKAAKKKSTLELSLENDVRELKSAQQTFENKMKLLNAEEKLAVEQAKRMIESKVAEQERIQSIHVQYSIKRAELMRKEIDDRIDYEMKDLKKAQEASDKAIAIKEKEAGEFEDLTNYVYGLIDKQRQDDLEKAKTAYDKLIDLAEDFSDSIKEAGAMEAAENKKWWETKEGAVRRYWEKVTEQELAGYLAQRERLAEQVKKMEQAYGGNSEQYANALGAYMANEKDIQDAQNRLNKFREEEGMAQMNWLTIIIAAWRSAMDQIVEAQHEAYSQTHDAYASVIDVYDDLIDANKKAMEQIFDDTTLTYDEMEEKVRGVMRNINEIMREQWRIDDALARSKGALAEFDRGVDEVNQSLDVFSSVISLDVNGAIDGIIRMVGNLGGAWDRARAKEEAARQEMAVNQYKRQIEAIEMEIDLQTQLLQKKFELWDQELAKYKEIKDEEMRKADEAAAAEKARNEQASSDQQLRLKNDDIYRSELLAQGEAREVAALEAAKQREVQRAQERGASAEEVARIVNSFELLITEKHKEYSDAKGNKDAEVSLATKERKEQEADFVNTVEENLKNEINRLKEEILAKEREVSANKQAAQKEYADYVKQLQGMQFEAERQMAIAQIRVEIALLKSKKNLFNKGKINDAIGDLEAAINEIAGVGNPYGYENPSRGEGNGNVVPPRDPSEPGRPGADPNPGTGSPDDPGRGPSRGPRFHGDTWVTRNKWDPRAQYGIDQIETYLHEGERVLPTYLNQFLGPKVTNEALVHGFLQSALLDRLPDTSIPQIPQMVLPDFSMSGPASISTERLENEIREMRKAFEGKPTVSINVDQNGVGISEMRNQQKIHYYNTFFKD